MAPGMAGVSHQTVRLAAGRHRSPADGACVMELASMLAGEPFSDRPRCVDPVLAAYMRALNDRLPPGRRNELLPYASCAVGTSGDRRVTRARRRRCRALAGNPLRTFLLTGLRVALSPGEAAARAAVAGRAEPFDVLDALLAEGGVASPRSEPAPVGNEAPVAGVTPACAAT
jgi:hypothetical protein